MSSLNDLILLASQHAAAGRVDEAEAALRGAVAMSPLNPRVNRDLGLLLLNRGEASAAAECFRVCVMSEPANPGMWYELARALSLAQRDAEALEAAERSLRLAPGALPTCHLIALVSLRADDPQRAAEAVEQGLAATPNDPDLLYLGAQALKALGMVDEAAQVAGRVASMNMDNPDYLMLAAWQATYSRFGDPIAIRNVMERRGKLIAPASVDERFSNSREPERPLRVGFLCQDIQRDSPIARFIAAPLLHLDRARFEVRGYLTEPTLSEMTERLKHAVDSPGGGWVDVSGLSDEAIVARLRADGIDILVETAGSTAGHRQAALARRGAPVQVTCIGDPRTTGNPAMDYRVVDDFTDPASNPDADRYCTERLVRLPGCFLCYEPHDDAPAPRTPIGNGPITFGSFNITDKTGPGAIELWSRILREVPGSRLMLKSFRYGPPGVRERFLGLFAKNGVEQHRVEIIAGRSSMAAHLAAYGRVDIALDTFPYNGTTTTCDALWAGVPVVVLAGGWHVSRVGVSLMNAAGLPELIASDPDDYVRIAVSLANDRVRLAELHRTLRERVARSALVDAAAYAQRLGEAYRGMWRGWCAGK